MEKRKLASEKPLIKCEIPAPMKCGGCGFTQVVNVVFLENQKIRTVNWSCPNCGDGKRAKISRLT